MARMMAKTGCYYGSQRLPVAYGEALLAAVALCRTVNLIGRCATNHWCDQLNTWYFAIKHSRNPVNKMNFLVMRGRPDVIWTQVVQRHYKAFDFKNSLWVHVGAGK